MIPLAASLLLSDIETVSAEACDMPLVPKERTGGGRPRALRYALYPSKSMLMLNFLMRELVWFHD